MNTELIIRVIAETLFLLCSGVVLYIVLTLNNYIQHYQRRYTLLEKPLQEMGHYSRHSNKDVAGLYGKRSRLFLKRGVYEAAISECKKAIAYNPEIRQLFIGQLQELLKNQEPQEKVSELVNEVTGRAITECQAPGSKKDPQHLQALNSDFCFEQQLEPSEQAFEQARSESNWAVALLYCNRARVFLNRKQRHMAFADCRKAINLNSKLIPSYRQHGLDLLAKGLPGENLLYFIEAVACRITAERLASPEWHMLSGQQREEVPETPLTEISAGLEQDQQAYEAEPETGEPEIEALAIESHFPETETTEPLTTEAPLEAPEIEKDLDSSPDQEKPVEESEESLDLEDYSGDQSYTDVNHVLDILQELNDAIKANPDNADAYILRGEAYLRKKQFDNAIADFNQAIELDADNYDAFINRGQAMLSTDNYDAALQDFSQAIKLTPTRAEPYRKRGEAYIKKNLYDFANNDFNQAIKIDPHCASTYISRGAALAQRGQHDDALADFSAAINCEQIYEQKVLAGHSSIYESLIDGQPVCTRPRIDEAYARRGEVYFQKDCLDEAIEDFNKTLMICPENIDALMNRGNIYIQLGKNNEAFNDFHAAIKLEQNLEEDQHYLNQFSDFEDTTPSEPTTFEDILADNEGEIDVDDHLSLFAQGNNFYDRHLYDHAIILYQKTIQLNPEYADAYINRGRAYSKKGQLQNALLDYNQAVAYASHSPDIYFNRARLWEEINDTGKAMKDYKLAVSLGSEKAGIEYKRLETNLTAH